MPKKKTSGNLKRLSIDYWEGVNRLVSNNLSKKQELSHAENARSKKIGSVEKREGFRRLGNEITATANYGLFYFDNDTATGFFRISTVSATTTIYYLSGSALWTALSGGGTSLTAAQFSHTIAEGCCFLVNNTDANRYISSDGTTVVTSATATGHLYGSPVASKVNYYKDRLYLGDYTATTRYKNGIMMSSKPLGIVSLVDGDHDQPVTSLKVTDIKYIQASDALDLYRGGTKIGDVTVTAKNADANTLTISSFGTDIKSSDELWVDGTYTGTKVFRWADNPKSGTDVKQYDTFKLTGNQNDAMTVLTNVGDVQLMGNKNNLAVWNDYNLKNFDIGIGCVSDTGYVVALGVCFFIHYTGIYATIGEAPKLMSAKIEDYITGASKAVLEAACMGRKGMSVLCGLSATTLYKPDGSIDKVLNNVVLEYNLRTENWYVHTGLKATQFATYPKSADADALEFASTETKYHIYELFNGQIDDRVANDKEIPFRIDSQDLLLSENFEGIGYPVEVIIEAERGSNIQCFVSLDDKPFYEIEGTARKGVSILKVTSKSSEDNKPPRCRKIKLSIRDFSTKLCKINRVAVKYYPSPEVEEPHKD